MASPTGMKQRCWAHDYCAPSFYMITIVTEPRRNCLSVVGEMQEQGAAPATGPAPAGPVVGAAPAGPVVGAAPAGPVVGAAPAPTSLWETGYQDTILLRRGQLKNMANYIADNPRRLAIKRANPNLFTVARDLTVAPNRTCPGFGNLFLLDYPVKRQVQVSRRISPEALADKKEELRYAATHGAVLVSPCISPGEKEIARAALDAGLPLIVVLANGFSPMYKPSGKYFDACASGRLLMLAPFAYHREKTTITRDQCLTLNAWAEDVVNRGEEVA